jgi:transcriptional regulator with XRE-family HTH domain
MVDTRKRTGDKDFGLRLRKCREARGLTQAQLAARSGVAQNSISGYETGSVMPESKDLGRLARAVGARIELLLEGVPSMPNEVEKFLLALPKRTWRKILRMSPQELDQVVREIAALIEAKPTKRRAGKPRPR